MFTPFDGLRLLPHTPSCRIGEIEHKPKGYWLAQSTALSGPPSHRVPRKEVLDGSTSRILPERIANHPQWDVRWSAH